MNEDNIKETLISQVEREEITERAAEELKIEKAKAKLRLAEDLLAEGRIKYAAELATEKNDDIPRKQLNVIWDKDLASLVIERPKWVVDRWIPQLGITTVAGKRSSFKSYLAMHMAACAASGKPMLSTFRVEPTNVLYVDAENGVEALQWRVEEIKKGMGITEPLEKLGFVSMVGLKLEDAGWRDAIEEFLKEHNPCIIIVDSFRRIIEAEENDAGQMNEIFTEYMQPLTMKYNCSWVLLHHLRKSIAGNSSEDVLDEIRGSSELANISSSVIVLKRNRGSSQFMLINAKSRNAKEQPTLLVEVLWPDDGSVIFENLGATEETQLAEIICGQAIMKWVGESGRVEFKTKDFLENIKGHSERIIHAALGLLVKDGKLDKPQRGTYKCTTARSAGAVRALGEYQTEGGNCPEVPEG